MYILLKISAHEIEESEQDEVEIQDIFKAWSR